jgi:hypothetical protein
VKLRKRDVPTACKQTVHAKRRGEMFAITTTRKPLRGPVTSFVPSWLRLATELTLWPCRRPPLAEAKRLKSALRNVASVGLSVQQSTSSGREGYSTYKSLPVITEALSYQSSSTTAVSYLIARRGGSPF